MQASIEPVNSGAVVLADLPAQASAPSNLPTSEVDFGFIFGLFDFRVRFPSSTQLTAPQAGLAEAKKDFQPQNWPQLAARGSPTERGSGWLCPQDLYVNNADMVTSFCIKRASSTANMHFFGACGAHARRPTQEGTPRRLALLYPGQPRLLQDRLGSGHNRTGAETDRVG